MEKLQDLFHSIGELLSYKLYYSESITITVASMLAVVVALVIATFFLKLIQRLVTAKLPEGDKNKFVSIFGFLKYLLYVLIVIIVLSSSGVDLTVLLTASAALFVGLGFALQYLFQDIISGVLMIMDQSLHVGDIIEVDNKVGRVFEIRLRTTRAVTRDDKVIVIPNHIFLTETIYNYTQNHSSTRESVKVGVAYGSDVNLVTRLLLQAVELQKGVMKTPKPFVLFEDFGDSALLFSVHFFITDSFADPKLKSQIRYAIDAKFRENKVIIPFPQRDVHIYQNQPFEHVTKDHGQPGKG